MASTRVKKAESIEPGTAKQLKRGNPNIAKYGFKPGQSGNPAGRERGSRNKLSESFVADMLADWQQHGAEAIKAVRAEDPSTYLRVVAGLIPKEFSLKDNRENSVEKFLEQFTDEQLEEFERAVAAITAIPINKPK